MESRLCDEKTRGKRSRGSVPFKTCEFSTLYVTRTYLLSRYAEIECQSATQFNLNMQVRVPGTVPYI